jgi:hypothetical protein
MTTTQPKHELGVNSRGRLAHAAVLARARYRRSGADLPFGDPCGYHGTALEGYFWRITEPRSGTVVIVMASVNRDPYGIRWGTAAVAAHPEVPVHVALADTASGLERGVGLTIADAGAVLLSATQDRLSVDLPDGTHLRARIEAPITWRRRALGGIGIGHLVPGLSQYWHPHLLGGRVHGEAVIGGRTVALDGATVYAEKNWSTSGFPREWWWGQAHGFEREDVCVAFAGGRIGRGSVTARASAVVARIGGEIVTAAQPLQPIRTRIGADEWSLTARAGRHTIEIEGWATESEPHRLPVPVPLERRLQAEAAVQHLSAQLHLTVRAGRRVLFRGTSALAGLERGAADGLRDRSAPSVPGTIAP